MIKHIVYLISIVLLTNCVSKKVQIPDDIIDANTFTAIMIDVQIREGMASHVGVLRGQEAEVKGYDPYASIFQKYDVKTEEFKRTYDFYSQHPALMEGIYEQVLDSLSKLEAEVKQRFTKEERAKADSIQQANQKRSDSIKELLRPVQK